MILKEREYRIVLLLLNNIDRYYNEYWENFIGFGN